MTDSVALHGLRGTPLSSSLREPTNPINIESKDNHLPVYMDKIATRAFTPLRLFSHYLQSTNPWLHECLLMAVSVMQEFSSVVSICVTSVFNETVQRSRECICRF